MIENFRHRSVEASERYPIHSAQALVFAGGLGSRAQELTSKLGVGVKHLLPTNYSGGVVLDHSIEAALRAGVGKINLIVSYHTAPAVVPHAQTNHSTYGGISIFEHNIPTAGVAQVFDLFVKYRKPIGPLIKLEGDKINDGLNLAEMYRAHSAGAHPITYLVTQGQGSYRYKLFADQSGLVHTVKSAPFSESEKSAGFDLSGTFIINPSMVELFLKSGNTLNFLQQATALKKLFIYHHGGKSININTPDDYQKIIAAKSF